jgi:pimeloyl-ACP methyl ester carboxylesterase
VKPKRNDEPPSPGPFDAVRRRMIGVLLATLVGLLGVVGFLLVLSPGRPPPILDHRGHPIPGSLSERVFLEINGVRQGMIIQSADPSNPVLLFLHGGPGMPQFFLNATHPTGLEQDFTMVWWEQRGAGMSYHRGIPPSSMTTGQLIKDAMEVASYLRDRFGQDRILLMGHSWGSFLGIQVAAAAPELFHAYVGMGQVSHQLRAEVAAHAHMVEAYRARGDRSMVRRLQEAPVDPVHGPSHAYLRLRDRAMHRLGIGTTRDMDSVITGVFFPVWRARAYTLREKINVWRGLAWSRQFLWEDFLRTDLAERVDRLEVPVHFFIGQYDYTVNPDLARGFFLGLDAPRKAFHLFPESAHSPLFEEPERARRLLLEDVLQR